MLPNLSDSFLENIPMPAAAICMVSWFAILSFLNAFYIHDYHLKITRYIVHRAGMGSTFIQAFILCVLNSIPKVLLMISLHQPSSIKEFAATVFGSTHISVTIAFAAVLLSAKANCLVHHTSFYKDIFFLEISHFLLVLLFSSSTSFLAIPLMALGIVLIFLSNTVLLPAYIAPIVNSGIIATSSPPPSPILAFFLLPTRMVFSMILLDPSEIPKKTSYSIIFSPLISLLIALIYFPMGLELQALLFLSTGALLLGLVLYTLARRSVLPEVLYLYSLVVSIIFFSMTMGSFLSLVKHINRMTGAGIQFLSGTLLAFQANLAEIITCSDYSRNGSVVVAVCSILYTHIYNSMLAFPILKLFSSKDVEMSYPQNISGIPVVYFSYVFMLAELKVIFVNYILRHHKLTKDLAYTLIGIYVFFMIGFSMQGRASLSL